MLPFMPPLGKPKDIINNFKPKNPLPFELTKHVPRNARNIRLEPIGATSPVAQSMVGASWRDRGRRKSIPVDQASEISSVNIENLTGESLESLDDNYSEDFKDDFRVTKYGETEHNPYVKNIPKRKSKTVKKEHPAVVNARMR